MESVVIVIRFPAIDLTHLKAEVAIALDGARDIKRVVGGVLGLQATTVGHMCQLGPFVIFKGLAIEDPLLRVAVRVRLGVASRREDVTAGDEPQVGLEVQPNGLPGTGVV